MRVIQVTGGRTFGVVPRNTPATDLVVAQALAAEQHKFLCDVLDEIHDADAVHLLIHGYAPGADTLSLEWACTRGIHALGFPANWDKHGRAAGPIRNGEMKAKCVEMRDQGHDVLVVAFPGGRGTANMIEQCRRADLRIQQHFNLNWSADQP